MITFAILILIVAKALPGLNTHISSIHVTRITSIVFLFAGALSLNSLNLESIGSGIGIYSGLFQVTSITQLIEIFLFMIGGGILIAWPQIKYNLYLPSPSEGVAVPATATLPHSYCKASEGGRVAVATAAQSLAEREESNLEKFTLFLTDKHSTDYSLVVLFSSLGSSLLISSYDLISVYLSIELQSFGLYVLSTLYRDSESSTSAGLKYFLLGGLSSCIILLGTGIIYSYTGTTNLESLYIINSVVDVNQQYIITDATPSLALLQSQLWLGGRCISLGLSLIFIGFLFKIAAAPLHNWSPDVYDGTPTIVTTWLTIIPKIAILFILLELHVKLGSFGLLGSNLLPFPPSHSCDWDGIAGLKTIIINSSGYLLKTLLLISATLSLIIGSLLGLAQIKIKRLLAYSTISHIGFILLALAINTEQSIDSFIFYIIQYTITNLNIFLVILGLTYCAATLTPLDSLTAVSLSPKEREGATATASLPLPVGSHSCGSLPGEGGENKDISYISEFKGLFFSNPLLSLSLAVSLFSMAGIPPLIGFFSKQLVLYSALQNGYYFISVLAIIVSVISCSYYLQIIKILLTKSPNPSSPLQAVKLSLTPNPSPSGGGVAARYAGEAVTALQSQLLLPLATHPYREGKGEVYWRKKNEIILTNTHSYLISTLTFTILLFFIKPSLILNSTQLLSLSLFYI